MSTDERCELLCLDLDCAEAIRAQQLGTLTLERAAERASALSDLTRLSLATALHQTEELCVCDLAWIVGRAQNLVSHHLRTLRAAGLVSSRRDGKMVMYALTDEARALLVSVLGESAGIQG